MAAPVRPPTALVDAATLAKLLTPADWLAVARRAYRAYGRRAPSPPPLALPLRGGSVHVKAAATATVVAVKINANLPDNPRRRGLPTIQGVVVAIDPRSGQLRALVDSGALTAWRTAAATLVALRVLGQPPVRIAAIIGCGVQGRAHAALLAAMPGLRELRLYDQEPRRAAALARLLRPRAGVEIRMAPDLQSATAGAHAILCCTSAQRPYLRRAHVAPGCTVAAVGADHPRKRELHAGLLARATLVVDSRAQALAMGEWHHARKTGPRPAEIGEILRGERRGRRRPDEIIVFDSTGFGLQDAHAVQRVLERLAGRISCSFTFAGAGRRRRPESSP